jgi:hypothetical protein
MISLIAQTAKIVVKVLRRRIEKENLRMYLQKISLDLQKELHM